MIKIEQLIPFMRNGWVAMDSNGEWWWYEIKPEVNDNLLQWMGTEGSTDKIQDAFDIERADDWKKSLIKIDQVLQEKE